MNTNFFDKNRLKDIPLFYGDKFNNLKIKRLGGWSNESYKLIFDSESYFLKINKDSKVLKIDRLIERNNSILAFKLGISAGEVLYSCKENILQVSSYIEHDNKIYRKISKDDMLFSNAVKTLKKLHVSKTTFSNELDVYARLSNVYHSLKRKGYLLPVEMKEIMQKFKEIIKTYCFANVVKVPCHNDPTPYNFLKEKFKSKLKLIDWEHSGNNDPAWDLAYLSSESNFSSEHDLLMLNVYGRVSKDFIIRFWIYKPLVDFWMSLWLHLQIFSKNYVVSKDKLIHLSNRRLNRCKRLLKGSAFRWAELNMREEN